MKKPLKDVPNLLKEEYTYGGRIQVKKYYIGNNFPTNRTSSKWKIILELRLLIHNTSYYDEQEK